MDPIPKILIVDDYDHDRSLVRAMLSGLGGRSFEFFEADGGETGLQVAQKIQPDCILLDLHMFDMDGLEFVEKLQSDSAVVFLTSDERAQFAVRAMKAGACDYLNKDGLRSEGLLAGVDCALDEREKWRKEQGRQEMLRDKALRDGLTGLWNRTALEEQLGSGLEVLPNEGGLRFVLLLDLDDFMPINDNYGHEAGDRVLQVVADRLVRLSGPCCQVGRLGGDEFLLLGHGEWNELEIQRLAQDLVDGVFEPIVFDGSELQVGVSIGIAPRPETIGVTGSTMTRCADAAMYDAKGRGKGGIAVCDRRNRSDQGDEAHGGDRRLYRDRSVETLMIKDRRGSG